MIVEYEITTNDGLKSKGRVDWDNRQAVREFAVIADRSLREGSTVQTRAYRRGESA